MGVNKKGDKGGMGHSYSDVTHSVFILIIYFILHIYVIIPQAFYIIFFIFNEYHKFANVFTLNSCLPT